MTVEVFVDTNVLLYSIDEDPASRQKRQRAREILLTERWGWSVQVASEFFVNATSARRPAGQNYDGVTVVDPFAASPAP